MFKTPRWVITAIALRRWIFCGLLEGRCFEGGACGYSFIKTFLLISHPNGFSPFSYNWQSQQGVVVSIRAESRIQERVKKKKSEHCITQLMFAGECSSLRTMLMLCESCIFYELSMCGRLTTPCTGIFLQSR